MNDFSVLLAAVESGRALTRSEMRRAMDALLDNEVAEEDVGAFLLALRRRGETVDEIIAATEAIRAKALSVKAPPNAIDTCGTGGDGADTFNISTAVAMIVAGCGVPVAKHGNRSASSRSGSSEVLAAMGVNLKASPETIARCIENARVGFMFAAYHHRAVAHVAAVRKKLGVRTIFNVLGPLSNPAGARRQLLGVFDAALTRPLASALGALGTERAWVVAGSDGLDELTTTGVSYVAQTHKGEVTAFEIAPEDAGIPRAAPEDLKGGSPEKNADALLRLLKGELGPYRDIALLNAAAALVIADAAPTLPDGAQMAAKSIDDGRARKALDLLISISNEPAP
ncbi:MAG: anthranilate phosphoribosyltransferase [Parvularculaceae bacterium]|nr:anthranilate phosphoribosyltransferase [Parvularculaceae bacterium]